MADIITTKSTLQNVFTFADNDTRTVNVDDPHDSITAADVQDWVDFAVDKKILIGDKTGAALTGIKTAKVIDATATKLDIN